MEEVDRQSGFRGPAQLARDAAPSWVVHRARAIEPVDGPSLESGGKARKEILYARDLFWNDPALPLYDPRALAWVSQSDATQIMPKLSGRLSSKNETVKVSYPDPQRAILEVTLESPGLVILADVDYPGWQLTIDDVRAPIYRVNVCMRGALISAGGHRLVYSFAPQSFRIGLLGSVVRTGAWLLLGLYCIYRPTHPVLAAARSPPRNNSGIRVRRASRPTESGEEIGEIRTRHADRFLFRRVLRALLWPRDSSPPPVRIS